LPFAENGCVQAAVPPLPLVLTVADAHSETDGPPFTV
jgi:hypothetical protein